MFEINKKYEFKMLEAGDDVSFWGTIESYDHPLIKLKDVRPEDMPALNIVEAENGETVDSIKLEMNGVIRGQIINVTSPSFVSATKQD